MMATLALERPRVGWSFWLQWVTLMSLFLCLSYSGVDLVLRPIVARTVPDPWVREATIAVGLAILGTAVGFTQWLLLRQHLRSARTWGLSIAATFWVGASLTELASFAGVALLPSFVLSFLLLGPVCGLLQWLSMRHQVARAGWWIVAQTLSWPMLFALSAVVAYGASAVFGGGVDDYLPVSYAIGGAALGATTGAVLVWLLRAPKRQ
jgi:hypothetical protein